MKIKFKRMNHIQICIPKGGEQEVRRFYCGLLGLKEIEKPEDLKKNGGIGIMPNFVTIASFTKQSFQLVNVS